MIKKALWRGHSLLAAVIHYIAWLLILALLFGYLVSASLDTSAAERCQRHGWPAGETTLAEGMVCSNGQERVPLGWLEDR